MAKRIGKGILGNRDATPEEFRLAMGETIYAALREQKRQVVPAVTMRDGKVVIVQPDDIIIPDDYLNDVQEARQDG